MHYRKLSNFLAASLICTSSLTACIPMPTWNVTQDTPKPDNKPKVFAPIGYNNAISAAKAGNYDEAIKQFSDIATNNPDFGNAYTNIGLLQFQRGNKNDAEQAFRKAISLNTKDAVSYNHLGIILREQGKFAEAKDMYQNALQADPNYALAWLNLGILNDIYLQDLPSALTQYNTYQRLTGNQDKDVEKWIVDLDKRIQSAAKGQS